MIFEKKKNGRKILTLLIFRYVDLNALHFIYKAKTKKKDGPDTGKDL